MHYPLCPNISFPSPLHSIHFPTSHSPHLPLFPPHLLHPLHHIHTIHRLHILLPTHHPPLMFLPFRPRQTNHIPPRRAPVPPPPLHQTQSGSMIRLQHTPPTKHLLDDIPHIVDGKGTVG